MLKFCPATSSPLSLTEKALSSVLPEGTGRSVTVLLLKEIIQGVPKA